jgi:hypothetical protein
MMSGIAPVDLVASMLGRDPDDVCLASLTAFAGRTEAARTSVLKTQELFNHSPDGNAGIAVATDEPDQPEAP